MILSLLCVSVLCDHLLFVYLLHLSLPSFLLFSFPHLLYHDPTFSNVHFVSSLLSSNHPPSTPLSSFPSPPISISSSLLLISHSSFPPPQLLSTLPSSLYSPSSPHLSLLLSPLFSPLSYPLLSSSLLFISQGTW